MKRTAQLLALLLLAACASPEGTQQATNKPAPGKPNFIIFFADDLGYADIGPFNPQVDYTPHLQKLAADGVKLSDFYVSANICSPSRAALLTGRYHAMLGVNEVFFPDSWYGMDTTAKTLPQLLKPAGYRSMCVGKWHLGHHTPYLPTSRGFDHYYGIPYGNDMGSLVYLKDKQVVNDHVNQDSTTIVYAQQAQQFLRQAQGQPFFLYMAFNMPHVPLFASPAFRGKTGKGLYADVVAELDWAVGQVLGTLDSLGLAENTVVLFSSDNGPWLVMGEHGGNAYPLREGKQTDFDGGHKVPTLLRWPAQLQGGSTYTHPITSLDVVPSFCALAGVQQVPSEVEGRVVCEAIAKNEAPEPKPFFYYQKGELTGVRMGNYKLKLPREERPGQWWSQRQAAHDTLLFDLVADPGENDNLLAQQPEVKKELLQLLEARKAVPVPPTIRPRWPTVKQLPQGVQPVPEYVHRR